MDKFVRIFFLTSNFLLSTLALCRAYDVNLIGYLNDIRSISRHTSSFTRCLQDHCSLKLFKTRGCSKKSFSLFEKKLIDYGVDLYDKKNLGLLINAGLKLSGITIYTDSYFKSNGVWQEYLKIPNSSLIKFAYVVTESPKISKDEVAILNQYFDALIIPDQWLESVYRSSGVVVPIFVLPLVLDLQSLFDKQVVRKSPSPFIFGFSGVNPYRKNVDLLIKAFSKEFKNDPEVSLIIHTRFKKGFAKIEEILKNPKYKNITFLQKGFTRAEYEDFLAQLSCYVLLSKGEGFSITPREALALGLPCVLSNNTAHQVICDADCVASVPSYRGNPTYGKKSGSIFVFDCTVHDARKALRDVYEHYDHHRQRAQKGREWVKQYLVENLRPKYLSLVKPLRVILGGENKITDEYLMVNSRALFNKYKRLDSSLETVFEDRAAFQSQSQDEELISE